jgi:hypothetical protein
VTIANPSEAWTSFRQTTAREVPSLIWGHIPFGIHEQLGVEPLYITILRHPIDRVISIYRYIKHNEDHPLHEAVHGSGLSLLDFIRSGIDLPEVSNGQTRQLAGELGDQLDEEALTRAKSNLVEFSALGLTERFDESLILFRRRLGWKMPFYISKNVAHSAARPVKRTDATWRLLEEHNRLDMELYEFATDLFDHRTKSERGFRAEVGAFRGLNRLARVYKRARSREQVLRLS